MRWPSHRLHNVFQALKKLFNVPDLPPLGWFGWVLVVLIAVLVIMTFSIVEELTGRSPSNLLTSYIGDIFCEITKAERCLHRPKIDDEDWRKTQRADTEEGYDLYLKLQPQGRYVEQARHAGEEIRKDNNDWSAAQRIDTAQSYDAYLKAHSPGRHADEARRASSEIRKDNDDWKKAQAGGEIQGYRAYLQAHPRGRYMAEANVAVAKKTNKDSALRASAERALAPLKTFKECEVCPMMVTILGGRFEMGSPPSTDIGQKSEWPQHKVTIGGRIAVGQMAVTFKEWNACVEEGGCGRHKPEDQGIVANELPVTGITWHDANAYVDWLSNKTGKKYRLLSEAEREFVTRAGTTTSYWTGDLITPSQANFDNRVLQTDRNFAGPTSDDYRERILSARSFPPNPWNLYQVHGNVWEWVSDCWHDNYEGAPSDGSAWTKPDCQDYVVRGGSFMNPPEDLRSACRQSSASNSRTNKTIGFRVARSLSP